MKVNKQANYKSLNGKVMSWIDWIFDIQDFNEIDWPQAESAMEELIDDGRMVEV